MKRLNLAIPTVHPNLTPLRSDGVVQANRPLSFLKLHVLPHTDNLLNAYFEQGRRKLDEP